MTMIAVDVNIYGSAAAARLRGNHENTEVGEFIRDYLGLNLDPITRKLQEKASASDKTRRDWMGRLPDHPDRLDRFDEYHGDF